MIGTQKALVPGIIFSCLLLFLLQQLVKPIGAASAAAEPLRTMETDQATGAEISPQACQFHDRYPAGVVEWCGLIEANAQTYGIDPLLIAAVMAIESGGQPEVISVSGAVGLMQVMPSDGIAAGFQCINGPCFSSRPTIAELKDPDFNVMYGTRMLAGLIERAGNARDGLQSYGPADVDYWYADKVIQLYESLNW